MELEAEENTASLPSSASATAEDLSEPAEDDQQEESYRLPTNLLEELQQMIGPTPPQKQHTPPPPQHRKQKTTLPLTQSINAEVRDVMLKQRVIEREQRERHSRLEQAQSQLQQAQLDLKRCQKELTLLGDGDPFRLQVMQQQMEHTQMIERMEILLQEIEDEPILTLTPAEESILRSYNVLQQAMADRKHEMELMAASPPKCQAPRPPSGRPPRRRRHTTANVVKALFDVDPSQTFGKKTTSGAEDYYSWRRRKIQEKLHKVPPKKSPLPHQLKPWSPPTAKYHNLPLSQPSYDDGVPPSKKNTTGSGNVNTPGVNSTPKDHTTETPADVGLPLQLLFDTSSDTRPTPVAQAKHRASKFYACMEATMSDKPYHKKGKYRKTVACDQESKVVRSLFRQRLANAKLFQLPSRFAWKAPALQLESIFTPTPQ
eukprot:TRINITY_DN113077_c0_g1_i1.p1 TRINITY_DN113077_c0_g1~~TRINITY_DN113077_c0_g1_i1.p1  ORF type:complete len:430 (+),score=46.24 TRINITY_DN113077_c0_g1_i1:77-1366(+)